MGQYVTRKDPRTGLNRQYYKADNGFLYDSFDAAADARWLSRSPGVKFLGDTWNAIFDNPLRQNLRGESSSPTPLKPETSPTPYRTGWGNVELTDEQLGRTTPVDLGSDSGYQSGYRSQPVTPVQPQYKIYPTTPEGQYERYFKTPELDYVFGAGARQGDEAPKDAAAMQILGNQLTADPESKNIASMYAAQSAMGRVNMPEILKMYEGNEKMQAWARENPMLAQREFLKAEARRAADMPLAPDQETVMGDLGSRAQGEGGYSLPEKTEAEAVEEAKAKLLRQAENQRLQAGGFEPRTPGLF